MRGQEDDNQISVNILYTATGEYDAEMVSRNLDYWRSRHHIVEFMDPFELPSYVRFHPRSSLALIDAIVCSADCGWNYISFDESGFPRFAFEEAVWLSQWVQQSPESCAMRDGKKWRSIPFIIFRSVHDHEMALSIQDQIGAHVEYVPPYWHVKPQMTLRKIEQIVDKFHQKVLADYRYCGIIVRIEGGRAQIGPALRKKEPTHESEFYYPSADKRAHGGWVTYMRDQQALRADVQMFQSLIDANANETEMHKFFEENPQILMQARSGIPISHQPRFLKPDGETPDFAITPVLGPIDLEAEILELKGPAEKLLTGGRHRGFAAKVKSAIDQVRDYERNMRDPANFGSIVDGIGYFPERRKLAVLIGLSPAASGDQEVRQRRQEEVDVSVITYDEILAVQQAQIRLF
jgi:hypothetical protein